MLLVALATFSLVSCDSGGGSSPSPSATPAQAATPSPTPSPSRPAVPPTSLRVTGVVTAATDPAAGENACFYGQPFAGEVRVSTPQMPLSDGQAFGIVIFSPPSIGSYAANSPAGNGQAIVRAQRTTRLGGGGDSGDWLATSGTVTVTQAEDLGNGAKYGIIAGTLNARLAWANGSQPITVQGTWGCVIDPVANGS
jgi:hypothetical protein